jgi:hypothetical protein
VNEKPAETTIFSLTDAPPSPPERRDGERHFTLFRVGALVIGERRELCLIKNISAGGMMIRAYCALEPQMPVKVELKHGSLVSGKVSWVQDQAVGVAFDSSIGVVELLASSMDGPRPRMPRVEIESVGTVRDGAFVHRIQARDISQGGVKIETSRDIAPGTDVVVSLTGLPPQPGVVCWRDSTSYGITFNRVVPLPLLVGWLQQQREKLRASG